MGSWVEVTHGEAQFTELAGTEGTATVSTQPGTKGLPLRLKGSLAQGLQLLPLLLGVIVWGGGHAHRFKAKLQLLPALCTPKAPTWL